MTFTVIDKKTGEYPDVQKIALKEEWASNLIYCDIDCFAIQEDGYLVLIDDCGNMAYCPPDRFEVRFDNENPWKAGHPSECMWVLVRLENGEYGFDYWEGNRWKNNDPERYVTPRVEAWCDYVDPCKDAH